jgi:tetratricopeptide (TPR) repeat protein
LLDITRGARPGIILLGHQSGYGERVPRSTTTAGWARREALVLSALGAAAALITLGVAAGLKELKVGGLIVAVAGALVRFGIAARKARIEAEVERTKLDERCTAPIAPVDEVDPLRIGVEAATQTIITGGSLPDYVPRSADDPLRSAIVAALSGAGPWMVVVQGPSKVGKSRSLFEALRACAAEALLVAPVDAQALQSLLTPGQDVRTSGRAVLWLNDLEPLANQGVTMHILRQWHADRRGRVVVATHGGKGSDRVDSPSATLRTIASEILQHAARVQLQATTAPELAAIDAPLTAGVRASLERHGLAAYMAAGALLEGKLVTGRHEEGQPACPDGVALVRAVVDWARCGRTDPIDQLTLRGLWPSYLPSGPPVSDERFEVALAWALEPVAGSIALIQHAGSYLAFDYVVRLVSDAPDAAVIRDEAWEAAVASAVDAEALAVASSAYFSGRRDIATGALERARTSTNDEVVARAGYNLGVVVSELGRSDEALVVWDEVLARFGDAPEPVLREHVASALVSKGVALGELQRSDEALVVYDDVVARFGDATEPALREMVAGALVNKGIRLARLLRSDEALVVCDHVVARFGDATEPVLREQVAKALVSKGVALGMLQRSDEALVVYDDVVARFGDATEPALHEQVAGALVNKGVALGELQRSDEALVVYDDVVARFGDATEPALREQVARALVNKSVTLGELQRSDEELVVYDDIVARFGDATEPILRQAVVMARQACDRRASE